MNLYQTAVPRRERAAFDRGATLRTAAPVIVIGGADRAVAEDLRLLNRRVSLVTVPEGGNTDTLRERFLKAGVDLQYCLPGINGWEQMTPDRLRPLLPAFNHAEMVITDSNLPEETLAWIAGHVTVPLAADPAPGKHAGKLKALLPRLAILKTECRETEQLTGFPVREDADIPRAAEALLGLGAQRVYITLGSRGAWAGSGREDGTLVPCAPGQVVCTAGCGDAFLAAAADAFLNGLGTPEGARRGLAAAAVCAEDSAAVSPRLSREAIDRKLAVSM